MPNIYYHQPIKLQNQARILIFWYQNHFKSLVNIIIKIKINININYIIIKLLKSFYYIGI